MDRLPGRLNREHETMRCMVEIYCSDHHPDADRHPCPECEGFLDYAHARLEKCPFGEAKPTCAKCPVHCYKREPREHAKAIMRYAGPRMLWRHPWLTALHMLDKLRRVEHPLLTRTRRNPR